jgi:V/A-type H+-transporting ATPase subunit F
MTTYNIAIIGPKDIILGYKALGVTPFVANEGTEAFAHLQKIKHDVEKGDKEESRFAVVIIIESIAKQIPVENMDKISQGALPAIVVLPGIEGSTGEGTAKLKRLAEKAVGSDIL